MLLEFEVSPLGKADIPSVAEIEQQSQPEPWTARSFAEELERIHSRVLVARVKAAHRPAPGEKAPGPGRIAGYICFWCVFGEIQILNVAVHEDFRRRGAARLLLQKALDSGCGGKASLATLEVRKSNIPARSLYESMGFRVAGERPEYYGAREEPAVIMELELDGKRG